jgi:guanyl-specific ribonuclease Sa
MRKFPTVLLLASATLGACARSGSETTRSGSESDRSASSSATRPAVAGLSRPGTSNADAPVAAQDLTTAGCPRTGQWALCSVEKRLVQSGFVVNRVKGDAPRRPGFSVVPTVYRLGRSRLEVFIYPSESALAADVAKIDTISVAPRGVPNPWPFSSPTFVRSANLAAVFLTDNPTQAERLTNAIAAGAPQR